jgi:hypothetical protein
VKPDPYRADHADEDGERAAKSRRLTGLWRRAFGNTAPGGASSTPSPTRGRSGGFSAPGVAEGTRREGAPGRVVGALGAPDPDTLHTVQRGTLTAVRRCETAAPATTNDAAIEPAVQSVQPAIRRFTGAKRTARVGPLRFTPEERERLHAAATAHGYWGESGFAADVTLAFIDGRFFIDLPLAEERRRTHVFRAQALRHLNRIGHNVNQIARAFNGAYEPPADFRRTLDELRHLLTQIAEALRQPTDSTEV